MSNELSTTGIMFTSLPTVAELVARDFHGGYWNNYTVDPEPFADWTVIAYNPHYLTYYDDDAEAMDETNYDVVVGELASVLEIGVADVPDVGSKYAYDVSVGQLCWKEYGVDEALEVGCALVNASSHILIVDGSRYPEAAERMRELVGSLENYPLLDESAYSELEWEAWQEYAPQALRDEIFGADRNGRYDESFIEALDTATDGNNELLSILAQHLHYDGGFTGEYGPDFLDVLDELLSPTARVDKYLARDAAKLHALLGTCPLSPEVTLHTDGEPCPVPDCPSNIAVGQEKFEVSC